MNVFISEFIGTALLLLLGNGVVANVLLNKTKGQNSGFIVITIGWAMAVFAAVIVSGASGAHLNPAVTIAMAAKGSLAWSLVLPYILAQLLGAALGTTLVWVMYKDHYDATDDVDLKLATFCNTPAIPNVLLNFITEVIGTFVLVFTILYFKKPEHPLGTIEALPVAFIVLAIGLCLGGPTGYAINPARDFMPRIMHFLLPIKNKRDSAWSYSWIPVVAPICGGLLAVFVNNIIG
jgi:glycerol uptake facilitator protein